MAKLFKLLRAEIVAHDDTENALSKALELTLPTLSQKINGKSEWKLCEMYGILDRYGIPYDRMQAIFPKGGVSVEATDCSDDCRAWPRRV